MFSAGVLRRRATSEPLVAADTDGCRRRPEGERTRRGPKAKSGDREQSAISETKTAAKGIRCPAGRVRIVSPTVGRPRISVHHRIESD